MESRVKQAGKGVRVLIVDDQPIFRAGLKAGLIPHREFEVIGESNGGADAAAKAKALRPDVIVLDIQSSADSGRTTLASLVEAAPNARVLVLTALNDGDTVREYLCSGAWGYTLKSIEIHDVVAAIGMVMKGARIVSEGIPQSVFQDGARARRGPRDASILSDRERQLLKGIAEGKRNKELARSLHLSVRTVEAHRYRITRKLGIRNFADLVRYAISAGIAKPI